MKFIYLILASLYLFSCSSGKREDLSYNDATHIDSVASSSPRAAAMNTPTESNVATDEPIQDSVITMITNAFNEIAKKYEQGENQFYSASFSFSGYESANETNWYFDSLMNLKYCKGNWDMEGTGGSFAYYFEAENLIAAQVIDEGQISSEHKTIYTVTQPIYGFNLVHADEQENDTTYLSASDYSSVNAEAFNQYQKLLTYFLDNSAKAVMTEDVVRIDIENKVNYGEDFVETQSSSMSKLLYQKVIKK